MRPGGNRFDIRALSFFRHSSFGFRHCPRRPDLDCSDPMTDFKSAFRQLLKNPGFTAVAVLTLALGIGANTVMYSLADFFFLRPLPVPRPDDLRRLYLRNADRPDRYRDFSYAEYQGLRDGTSGVASLLAHQMTMVGVTGPEFT